jgi:hypothetical protein
MDINTINTELADLSNAIVMFNTDDKALSDEKAIQAEVLKKLDELAASRAKSADDVNAKIDKVVADINTFRVSP